MVSVTSGGTVQTLKRPLSFGFSKNTLKQIRIALKFIAFGSKRCSNPAEN